MPQELSWASRLSPSRSSSICELVRLLPAQAMDAVLDDTHFLGDTGVMKALTGLHLVKPGELKWRPSNLMPQRGFSGTDGKRKPESSVKSRFCLSRSKPRSSALPIGWQARVGSRWVNWAGLPSNSAPRPMKGMLRRSALRTCLRHPNSMNSPSAPPGREPLTRPGENTHGCAALRGSTTPSPALRSATCPRPCRCRCRRRRRSRRQRFARRSSFLRRSSS
jgi:hypothetical protein